MHRLSAPALRGCCLRRCRLRRVCPSSPLSRTPPPPPRLRPMHSAAALRPTAVMDQTPQTPQTSQTPTYADAIALLNSTQSGFKAVEQRFKAGAPPSAADDDPVGAMTAWLRHMGYAPADLDRLNVVHVAGTKGKGTTCALTNAILERYTTTAATAAAGGGGGRGPRKIGLYTSPHLVAVRERIRINSEPLAEELFARYFFEVWRALEAAAAADNAGGPMPTYFRLLTLVSLHAFVREGVDVAIYEVGVGGERDATNVFVRPAATAVTTLGIDHVALLGATLDKIAWHKAGVFKPGCPAFTVPQAGSGDGSGDGPGDDRPPDIAMPVLRARAAERGTALTVLDPARFAAGPLARVRLRPPEPFQRTNAALAVALAATVLRRLGVPGLDGVAEGAAPLPAEFVDGLENAVWRGRCETLATGRQRWYLDGAHNRQSLDVACRWFARTVQEENKGLRQPPPNVLIFNQQSMRDAVELLHVVHDTLARASSPGAEGVRFQYAFFCTNVTYRDRSWKVDFVDHNVDPASLESLALQHQLAAAWRQLDPATGVVAALPTIQDAIDAARQIQTPAGGGGGDTDVRVFVTGSFRLVGGALAILEDDHTPRTAAADTT